MGKCILRQVQAPRHHDVDACLTELINPERHMMVDETPDVRLTDSRYRLATNEVSQSELIGILKVLYYRN
jgi:hypothetical protein